MTPALLLLLALAAPQEMTAVDPGQAPPESRTWFEDAKFGLFIHWGVYSLLGRGEWVMQNEKIKVSEYEKLPPQFDPTEFDAEEWARIAEQAGQRYIAITSKHHDGFCMWATKATRYNIVDGTPYKKDVLAMLREACRRHGLKLFYYHSHLDWHHPDYYPRGGTGRDTGRPESGDFARYMDYMNAQIAELCSPPYDADGIWFDGWWDRPDAPWNLSKTYGLIHRLRPLAMVGNNHHVKPFAGEDFQMFEQDLPGANTAGFNETSISPLPLETCRTMNDSWGYNKNDHAFRPLGDQIRYLVQAVGMGANLLLNVGPMPNGKFPPEAVATLAGIGGWLARHGESIYGTRAGPWAASRLGVSVRKGSRAYFHLLEWPESGVLTLPWIDGLKSVALESGAALELERGEGALRVKLPAAARDPIDTILVFEASRELGGVPVRVPTPPTALGAGTTVLGATLAETTGGIRYEPEPKAALGYWTEAGGTITFHVVAERAGAYEVSATYACAAGSGGSEFEVRAGDAAVAGKVFETGDWTRFVTVPLGLLELPAGPSAIVVRATRKPASAQGVMNLRSLTLEPGYASLFDGKGLTGWKLIGGEGPGYVVESGRLVCPENGGGNLFTEREYGDFSFRFEFRLVDGSNNGVGIRAPLDGDAAYAGMEIQILDDGSAQYAGKIQPWQHHGSIYGVVPSSSSPLRPTGEWNVEEIRVEGRRVRVELNGTVVVDANLDDVRDAEVLAKHPGLARASGHIGFLGHRSRVEFRNIRVRESR